MFNLKEWYTTRKRNKAFAEKEEQDNLALSIVLKNPKLIDKVAGVYLNGRQPLSGKDLRISGKAINLNCTAFYGGTFEGCTFINAGSDKLLLQGSHVSITKSDFKSTLLSKEDTDAIINLVNTRITQLERQIEFLTFQNPNAYKLNGNAETEGVVVTLYTELNDLNRVLKELKEEQTVMSSYENGGL